jgi:hypothetical protein
MEVSVSVAMNPNHCFRRHDNAHAEPERPSAQVLQIVFDATLHLLDLVCLSSEFAELLPSRDSRFNPAPVDIAVHHFLIELVVLNRIRATLPRMYRCEAHGEIAATHLRRDAKEMHPLV